MTRLRLRRRGLVPFELALISPLLVWYCWLFESSMTQSMSSPYSETMLPSSENGFFHGTKYGSKEKQWTCQSFFTVLSTAFIPGEQERGTCKRFYNKYREQIQEHNAQMMLMNSTMTIFTAWTRQDLQDPDCRLPLEEYPAIRVVQFDAEKLLAKHGFTQQHIRWIKAWPRANGVKPKHAEARLSDVFRILLAREHQMAYADLDMVHLMKYKEIYLAVPNVAVPIWAEGTKALEIQNSGFCFSSRQLDILIRHLKDYIVSKGEQQAVNNSYPAYTELGPNLLERSFQSMESVAPIRLYYTSSDRNWRFDEIPEMHVTYHKFVWMHFDATFQRLHKEYAQKWKYKYTWRNTVQKFRLLCPPPLPNEILPNYPWKMSEIEHYDNTTWRERLASVKFRELERG